MQGQRGKEAIIAAVSLCCAASATAIEPAYWQVGAVSIEPTVREEMRYMDNVLRTRTDKLGSWVSDLRPAVRAWVQDGPNHYGIGYEMRNLWYRDSSPDDFTDHLLTLDLHHEFDSRNALDITGEYYDGHELRGTGLAQGDVGLLFDRPIEYRMANIGAQYTLGNLQSRGRLELDYDHDRFRYDNFRQFTRDRDRDVDRIRGTFYYRVAARTDALAELRYLDARFVSQPLSQPEFDSQELTYLVGLQWSATAKTSGTFKVGGYDREFDNGARSNASGFRWELDAVWQPRSYSTVRVGTRQASFETNGDGSFVESRENVISWEHAWSARNRTRLGIEWGNDDFSDSFREDDWSQAEGRYTRSVRRWLDVGAGVRYEQRDSSDARFDFSLNVFFLDARVSL